MYSAGVFQFSQSDIEISFTGTQQNRIVLVDSLFGGGRLFEGKYQDGKRLDSFTPLMYRAISPINIASNYTNLYQIQSSQLKAIKIPQNTTGIALTIPPFKIDGVKQSLPPILLILKKASTVTTFNC